MCKGIDPSRLLLEPASRNFHGNFSCEGENLAGWGPVSESAELLVYCKGPLISLSSRVGCVGMWWSLIMVLSRVDLCPVLLKSPLRKTGEWGKGTWCLEGVEGFGWAACDMGSLCSER